MVNAASRANDPIVWIDCEMTGLDAERDSLVEVAVVVTNSELEPLHPGLDLVIKPRPGTVETMDEVVVEMHKASGLITELDSGLEMADAAAQVLEYIKRFVPEIRRAPLAGNSVGTDRVFLARDMPEVVEHLHYRIIDVSSVKELARRWYPRAYFQSPQKNGGHRALADILESIDELRYYRAVLWPKNEGPTTSEAKAAARTVTENPTSAAIARLAEPAPATD
ncbi:MAG: oligoribonuclease [Actinomycetaceae bacterium]